MIDSALFCQQWLNFFYYHTTGRHNDTLDVDNPTLIVQDVSLDPHLSVINSDVVSFLNMSKASVDSIDHTIITDNMANRINKLLTMDVIYVPNNIDINLIFASLWNTNTTESASAFLHIFPFLFSDRQPNLFGPTSINYESQSSQLTYSNKRYADKVIRVNVRRRSKPDRLNLTTKLSLTKTVIWAIDKFCTTTFHSDGKLNTTMGTDSTTTDEYLQTTMKLSLHDVYWACHHDTANIVHRHLPELKNETSLINVGIYMFNSTTIVPLVQMTFDKDSITYQFKDGTNHTRTIVAESTVAKILNGIESFNQDRHSERTDGEVTININMDDDILIGSERVCSIRAYFELSKWIRSTT
tara:strand:- start:746 stop:1810 length:1065 start_codon:yes stop_codon:yes gene_type:complete